MPRRSSVGWFGCSRTESRPGRPSVLRKRVTTRHLLATRIRSWLRISLLDRGHHLRRQAGRERGAASRSSVVVAQQPVAKLADGEVRDRREGRRDRACRRSAA